MDAWFFTDAGQQRGPVSKDSLFSLLANGKITPDTLVWSDGMAEWKSLSSVPELAAAPLTPTPPLRTAVSPYAPPAAELISATDWSDFIPSGPQVRPWVRYWARTFDYLLAGMIFGAVAEVASPGSIDAMPDTLVGGIFLFAYNFIEPALLASFGTTPFKALLNVRVRNHDGTKLSYLQGLRRTFSVWIFGHGIGIPLVTIIMNILCYNRLTKYQATTWDRSGGFTVSHQTVAWWRWLLVIMAFVGFIALIVYGMMQ